MLFTNANLFLDGCFQRGAFRVENGRFAEILTDAAGDGIDLHGQYVIPGLVDIHNHGNSGADFSDGDYDGLVKMAKYLAANGVTSFAPASMTLPYDVLEAAYKTAAALKKAAPEGCARLMGINMEGPFFSEKKKGAQNGAYLRDPDFAAFRKLYEGCGGLVRIIDVAPELPGACEFVRQAKELCTVSIAHTDADYEDVLKAREFGYDFVTHLYSGMSSLRRLRARRHLGLVETAFLMDDLTVEIIADGKHLPPELLRLIVKNKAWDRICLITDSMRGAGMPEGSRPRLGSLSDGQETVIADGVAYLPDRSAYAGSVCTADRCIQTMINQAGVPLLDAVRMMTVNPARALGIDGRKGILRPGMDADVCVFDQAIHIQHVFVHGELRYSAEEC